MHIGVHGPSMGLNAAKMCHRDNLCIETKIIIIIKTTKNIFQRR